jgi:hypothetical protein
MGEFDRIKPPERRALTRPAGDRLDDPAANLDGRTAPFSAAPDPDAAATGPVLGLAAHCSRCGATFALDPVTVVRAVLPLVVVLPWRDHPVFARCAACATRAWLRIEAAR